MKVPLILQDINNKFIPKNIIVTSPSFFIKSFSRFGIRIQDEYEVDLIGGIVTQIEDDKIFDTPYIYSVINPDDIRKTRHVKPEDANFSYTLYLGKTEKIIKLEIVNIFDDELSSEVFELMTIHYKPNNVLLDSQQHYNDLLINNDLPSIDKLLPAIIKTENEHDLIRKLLLDFKEIKKHRGKLLSIEKFLNFIGFDPDSIKLYAEYTTPKNNKTINPNKQTDFKNGFYHVLYDNWVINDNDKYTSKNLPKAIIQIRDVKILFDKLFYALVLANDYFTIPEQKMSFFGISNMSNSEQFLSITSNITQVRYIDTLSFFKNFKINIWNRTILDSSRYNIVIDNIQKQNKLKISEVKIYVGDNVKQNDYLFLIDKELSDNSNDTNLTPEEELTIEYLFGNVLNIKINSQNNKVRIFVKNLSNELIQFDSDIINTNSETIEKKLFIGLFGIYEIKIQTWDNYGTREEYVYKLNINETNIDFDIYNSTEILEEVNDINQDVNSPIFTQINNFEDNLLLSNSGTNLLLENDLKNYFDIVADQENKNLLGLEPYFMKLMNKNISMKDVTETLPVKFIDNFLNIISIRRIGQSTLEHSNDLFVKLMTITIDENTTEEHWFITTKTNSVNISKNLHTLNLVHNDKVYTIEDILRNNLPGDVSFKTTLIPINYDFSLFQSLDKTDVSNIPYPEVESYHIESVYPRLKNIEIDSVNNDDDFHSLKLGDIILCKIDEKYIVNATDITWTITNRFTNEVIHRSNDYSLKYRVLEKALYNISLRLRINNEIYTIDKKEIQTSFIL